MCNGASGQVLAERPLHFLRRKRLPLVQARENAPDDLLGLVLAVVLDEPVEIVFPRQRVVDFRLLVVVLQFGEYTPGTPRCTRSRDRSRTSPYPPQTA